MVTKVGGKAIMGIAMTVIVLAFVMVAMAPAVSAKDVTSEYTTVRNGFEVNPGFVVLDITDGDRDPIKIGQEIIFKDATDTVLIQGIPIQIRMVKHTQHLHL